MKKEVDEKKGIKGIGLIHILLVVALCFQLWILQFLENN